MSENIQEKVEDKIIDAINLNAGGRLIILKPEKNKFGGDLSVERRGEYKKGGYVFKISSLDGPMGNSLFRKDFVKSEIFADKSFYLIFAYFDRIKQKINDYVWFIPSTKFRDLVEPFKSEDGKDMLRFEVPLDTNAKNKFSKYLVNTKEFGKLIIEALESKGKFDFKESDFDDAEKINTVRLKEFISEARRNTYASNSASVDNPRVLGSLQFAFQKGDYSYLDIFFSGGKMFIGQEVVYQNSKPVWGMNYVGNTIGKLETNFLKESLFKLSEKCRFGQVCESEKREYKYIDQGQGDISKFFGTEGIYLKSKNVYTLNYRGGLI